VCPPNSKCKICYADSGKILEMNVLNKYPVSYLQCSECGFIQTEEHFWLEEAYANAISALDTGILQRNLSLSNTTADIINKLFNPSGKFLDFGGGFGIFVRLMRDKGYNFYRYDKYCENLFASYFDIGNNLERITEKFELATAFEVFEHLSDPLLEIEEMFKLSDTIFFTTELIPKDIKDLKEWWYFAPEAGQHISFYSKQSLEIIAAKFNAVFYSNGSCHILSKRRISSPFFSKTILRFKQAIKIYKRFREMLNLAKVAKSMDSLTWKDYEYIRQQIIKRS